MPVRQSLTSGSPWIFSWKHTNELEQKQNTQKKKWINKQTNKIPSGTITENSFAIQGYFPRVQFIYGGNTEISAMWYNSLMVKSNQIPWVWTLALRAVCCMSLVTWILFLFSFSSSVIEDNQSSNFMEPVCGLNEVGNIKCSICHQAWSLLSVNMSCITLIELYTIEFLYI